MLGYHLDDTTRKLRAEIRLNTSRSPQPIKTLPKAYSKPMELLYARTQTPNQRTELNQPKQNERKHTTKTHAYLTATAKTY